MDVAAARFAANGYHPTSIAEIVEAVGVGKGVFYWYFPSKEELFEQILVEAQRDLRRAQRAAIADEPDPLRRIEAGIRASIAWLDAHRPLFALFELARADERFAPVIRRGEEQAIADTLPHVVAGMHADLIRREDPMVVAHGILGVVDRLTRVLVLHENRSAEEVADAAVAFCLRGLLAPAAARTRLALS
jgi:AcrR family transcriptional regulator